MTTTATTAYQAAPAVPPSRRAEQREDARLRAELELAREAARAEQRRLDDRAWAEERRQARADRDARRAAARAGRAGRNESRRAWLREHRETALRFLRALLMANDVVQKDPGIAVRVWARELGIKEAWAEAIYDDVPPPLIREWTNPRYNYSLVKGSPLHRRLGFLATFLFDEKLISQPLDVDDVMDVSVIADVLKTRKSGP